MERNRIKRLSTHTYRHPPEPALPFFPFEEEAKAPICRNLSLSCLVYMIRKNDKMPLYHRMQNVMNDECDDLDLCSYLM